MPDPQTMILDDGSGLVMIHFQYLSPAGMVRLKGIPLSDGAKDTWKVACVPDMVELAQAYNRALPMHRSDDPRAVTCPECMRTEEFQEKMRLVKLAESGVRWV